jgi:hypothetical protein
MTALSQIAQYIPVEWLWISALVIAIAVLLTLADDWKKGQENDYD